MNTKLHQVTLVLLIAVTLALSGTTSSAVAAPDSVFRSLKFGDTRTTVRIKTLRDDFFSAPMVNLGKEALSPEGDEDLLVEDLPLNLIFFFNQGGLYRLDASGPEVSEDHFDTKLANHLNVLEEVISNRYGDPSYRQSLDPSEVSSSSFKTQAYWSEEELEGNREIWVGVSGAEDGYEGSLIVQDSARAEADPLSSSKASPPEVSAKEASELFERES